VMIGMAATPTMRAYAEATLGAGMLPEGLLSDPADNVRAALDGIEAGEIEILADPMAIEAKAALAGAPRSFDPFSGVF
jgi:hypothetical protein